MLKGKHTDIAIAIGNPLAICCRYCLSRFKNVGGRMLGNLLLTVTLLAIKYRELRQGPGFSGIEFTPLESP